MKKQLKAFVKSHPFLLRIVQAKRQIEMIFYKPQFINMRTEFAMAMALGEKIPNDFDCIIGIPRAGLLLADVIALRYRKPLATPDDFIKGIVWKSTSTKEEPKYKRILLMDDTVCRGDQLLKAIEQLKAFDPNLEIKTAALFVEERSKSLVNYYFQEIRNEHTPYSEFDLLKHKWNPDGVGKIAMDMDGVLCENCPHGADDNNKRYLEWIKNAKPHLIPDYEIDAIITTRRKKFRLLTEEWLKSHGIKYQELIMFPDDIPRAFSDFVGFKSHWIRKLKPFWYWESDWKQAKEIAKLTGKIVLCTDEMKIYS